MAPKLPSIEANWLTIEQVAAYYGVSLRTIYNWLNWHWLPQGIMRHDLPRKRWNRFMLAMLDGTIRIR